MVVVGSARAPGEGRPVCNVAWARQCLHHQQQNTKAGIKMAAQPGDALPVVELKPFTKKVWRREKSLPNFYDKQPVKDESGSESSRKAGSEPSPNIVRYIRELSEQRKTVDTRQSVDTTQRYRSKLHPKADFSFEGRVVTEHQQDLIPSFITRHERTKTSIMASQGEENGTAVPGGTAAAAAAAAGSGVPAGTAAAAAASSAAPSAGGREVSNLLAAYTRDKPLHQESVCLKGGKLTGNLGRRPLHYLTPFSAYRQKQPWTVCGEENSPVRCSPRNAVSLSLSRGSGGVTSSSANGVAGRRDLVLSGSTFRAHDKFPLQPLRVGHHSPHKFNNKLGAAHDSLSLLSRHGAPTVVERNLSYDLELRMERCRRERSFAAIGETNVLSTAHYVAYDSQPTRGEVTLMRAREANKSRDGRTTYRRNGLQKPLHHNSPNMNFMLARAVDHNVSPRSRSDQGDSGIQSSAGDVADDAPRIGEHHPANNGIVFPRDLGDEVILEQPGDCDEHYDDTERSEFVWDAAQAMWVPAEMAQHVLESIQKANRDDRRAAEHAQGEDMQTDRDHSEVKRNEAGQSRKTSKSKEVAESRVDPSNTTAERPKSDTVLAGGSGKTENGPKNLSELDKNEERTANRREVSSSEDSVSAEEISGVVPGADSERAGLTPAEAVAESESNEHRLGPPEQSSRTEHLPGTENTDTQSSDFKDNSGDNNKENKAFETRQPAPEIPISGRNANDVDLQSVTTNSLVSSPSNLDSGRDPVNAETKESALKANEADERMNENPEHTATQGLQERGPGGSSEREKSESMVERPVGQSGEAEADSERVISNPGDVSHASEQKAQHTSEGYSERPQSQHSGLPVCHDKQKDGVPGNSGTVSQNEAVAGSESIRSEADVGSGDLRAGVSADETTKTVDTENKILPEGNSGLSVAQSTILEHDTREDVAVLGTGSDADGIQEEVAPKELEKIASVSIVGAEQKDGFEGEKTFITTTNVESEDWPNLVGV